MPALLQQSSKLLPGSDSLLGRTFSTTDKRETLYRRLESWGSLQPFWQFSGVRGARKQPCLCHMYSPWGGVGSIQMLWPTCKFAAAHSRALCLSRSHPELRKQAGSSGHYYLHLALPPGATPPCLMVQCHRCFRHPLSS